MKVHLDVQRGKRLGAGQAAAAVAAYSQLNRAQALQERWGDGRQAARAAAWIIHLLFAVHAAHVQPEKRGSSPLPGFFADLH